MKKLLVVVLASDAQPWKSIQDDGQRTTWAADPPATVLWLHGESGGVLRFLARAVPKITGGRALRHFYRYLGRWAASRPVERIGDRLNTGVPETYLMTNAKTVAAFRHVIAAEEFDFLLRTNSSSYIHLPFVIDYIQNISSQGYYGGTTWEKDGFTYVTGTSILLSRDLVSHAAKDPNWDFDVIDDVAVGKSMARLGIEPVPVPRVDLYSDSDLRGLSDDMLKTTFIFRCRGETDRCHDISAMKLIHRRVTAKDEMQTPN